MAMVATPANGIRLKPYLLAIAAVAMLGLAWQLAILWWRIPHYLMPGPSAVASAVATNWKPLLIQTGYTLGAAGLGLAISTTLAMITAFIFTMNRTIEQATLPVVIAFRSAPVAAVAPIIMLFLGRGIATSIAVVGIVSFFPMLINMTRGLAAADATAIEMMHVYGASRWQQLRFVRIPYALPFLFTGLRVAATTSLLGAMLSEWITGSRGLGFLILESGEMREIELLWGAVLVSVTVSLSVFWLTTAGERMALRWKA
jgi:ABC-type nitrate/sulfonate/bicarbonate transport system permease component